MEAENLRELFRRVPNKSAFARDFSVPGGASMLSQHLSGHRPISAPAAIAYARGLGVSLDQISPRLAALVESATSTSNVQDDSAPQLQEADSDFLPGFQKLSVPLLANSGSMGAGDDDVGEEVITGALPVSPDWAQRTLKPTGLQNLRFIHGYGDSMRGTFEDGDILLVDIGVQEPRIDGVYVLEANDRVYIKRVRQRMDGSFEISSDNPAVRTVDVLDGRMQVKCRGRVLWAWNGKRM